jgi:hypothetical protein
LKTLLKFTKKSGFRRRLNRFFKDMLEVFHSTHEPRAVFNLTIASTLLRKARPFLFFPHQGKLNSDWIMRLGA